MRGARRLQSGIAVDADGEDVRGGLCVVEPSGIAEGRLTRGGVPDSNCGLEEMAVDTCQPPAPWLAAASRRRYAEQ